MILPRLCVAQTTGNWYKYISPLLSPYKTPCKCSDAYLLSTFIHANIHTCIPVYIIHVYMYVKLWILSRVPFKYLTKLHTGVHTCMHTRHTYMHAYMSHADVSFTNQHLIPSYKLWKLWDCTTTGWLIGLHLMLTELVFDAPVWFFRSCF